MLFAYGNCVIIIDSTVFGLCHNVHLISVVILSLSRLSIYIKYHPFCTKKYLDQVVIQSKLSLSFDIYSPGADFNSFGTHR